MARRGECSAGSTPTPTAWTRRALGHRMGSGWLWSGCGGLCIYDLAVSRRRSIALGGDDASGFAWSPDGDQLAAVASNDVVVVSAGDGVVRTVLAAAGRSPGWSRDGRWIAFEVASKLEVVPAAGGAVRTVARNVDARPVWSPRGHQLLFVTGTGVVGERVWVSDLVAGHFPRLVATGADGAATW